MTAGSGCHESYCRVDRVYKGQGQLEKVLEFEAEFAWP